MHVVRCIRLQTLSYTTRHWSAVQWMFLVKLYAVWVNRTGFRPNTNMKRFWVVKVRITHIQQCCSRLRMFNTYVFFINKWLPCYHQTPDSDNDRRFCPRRDVDWPKRRQRNVGICIRSLSESNAVRKSSSAILPSDFGQNNVTHNALFAFGIYAKTAAPGNNSFIRLRFLLICLFIFSMYCCAIRNVF